MNNTKTFQKKLMPLMVSLIAAGSSSFAFAQDDSVEEIVVSGYRESLAKALDIKRKDTTQVDAIVAEDIGKFPDKNVADALRALESDAAALKSQAEAEALAKETLVEITQAEAFAPIYVRLAYTPT